MQFPEALKVVSKFAAVSPVGLLGMHLCDECDSGDLMYDMADYRINSGSTMVTYKCATHLVTTAERLVGTR